MNISDWLRSIGMEEYEDNFLSNEIGIDDLAGLSSDELKNDLGIMPLGHRKKILEAINNITLIDESDEIIIQSYPYSIAYPYKLMLDEKIPSQRILLMKDVFLNVLKYLGILIASEYFLSDLKSKVINKLFIEKLYQPHFGNWNHFIRETLAFLTSEKHEFLVSDLVAFYNKVEIESKACKYKLNSEYTDSVGDIQIIVKNFTAIGGLINFRNRFVGHGVALTQAKSEIIYTTYFPLLKDLLSAMDFLPKYPLFKKCKGEKIKLMGIQPENTCPDINPADCSVSLWIETPAGKRLSLIPFFISPELYLVNVKEDDQLFIYEQYTSKRIVYFSPKQETGETSGEPVSILNKMLKDKARMEPVELMELTEEILENALYEFGVAFESGNRSVEVGRKLFRNPFLLSFLLNRVSGVDFVLYSVESRSNNRGIRKV